MTDNDQLSDDPMKERCDTFIAFARNFEKFIQNKEDKPEAVSWNGSQVLINRWISAINVLDGKEIETKAWPQTASVAELIFFIKETRDAWAKSQEHYESVFRKIDAAGPMDADVLPHRLKERLKDQVGASVDLDTIIKEVIREKAAK